MISQEDISNIKNIVEFKEKNRTVHKENSYKLF
jgi:hypothetical protein